MNGRTTMRTAALAAAAGLWARLGCAAETTVDFDGGKTNAAGATAFRKAANAATAPDVPAAVEPGPAETATTAAPRTAAGDGSASEPKFQAAYWGTDGQWCDDNTTYHGGPCDPWGGGGNGVRWGSPYYPPYYYPPPAYRRYVPPPPHYRRYYPPQVPYPYYGAMSADDAEADESGAASTTAGSPAARGGVICVNPAGARMALNTSDVRYQCIFDDAGDSAQAVDPKSGKPAGALLACAAGCYPQPGDVLDGGVLCGQKKTTQLAMNTPAVTFRCDGDTAYGVDPNTGAAGGRPLHCAAGCRPLAPVDRGGPAKP